MKNLGFKVQLNGEEKCRAGFDKKNYVTSCIFTSVNRKDNSEGLDLSVGGLDSDENKQVSWYYSDLQIGDKILIEIIDTPFDPPVFYSDMRTAEEVAQQKEEELKQKIAYFYALREELGEHIK